MAGGSALLVGKLAGHTETNTTMKIYTALGVEEMQQVNARINAENAAPLVSEMTN